MTPEEWKPVPGYEEYEASSFGRVRRLESNRGGRRLPAKLLKLTYRRHGYLRVSLRGRSVSAHRVIALAFHGLPEPGRDHVRHLNHTPTDNRPENLAWGSPKDNVTDMILAGRHAGMKKTHCVRGHPLTGENVELRRGGQRNCIRCHRSWRKRAGQDGVQRHDSVL